ncbi:hypothetical protein Tco_0050686, partial [Tanacetum coccineum]
VGEKYYCCSIVSKECLTYYALLMWFLIMVWEELWKEDGSKVWTKTT